MKRFRLYSILIVTVSCGVAILNAYYLVMLYTSIRGNLEREVKCAIADMDIDEMWWRTIAFNTGRVRRHNSVSASLNQHSDSIISHYQDEMGEHHVLNSKEILHDISYTNQMVTEMSNQMHAQMDGLLPMEPAIADSILSRRLLDRGIRTDFVAVELTDDNGSCIVANPKLIKNRGGKDVFMLTYDYDRGLTYRVYLSPLTRNIFREMSGVIVTTVLMIAVFAVGFWYLYHSVSRLKSIEEMKDDFTNNMTHELKTPIAIAYSANDALLNHSAIAGDEKARRYLRIAVEQLTRLSGLVENILLMSMERRRNMILSPEEINVRDFVGAVVEQMKLKASKPCRIHLDGIPAEMTLRADTTHFGNILTNLIDNAMKYSRDSVDITITASETCITVADNGIGIPSKNLPHIFDKFYRVPHGNLQYVRGYGIGLYYVKAAVERMGWSIVAASREGVGTEFTITFTR